VIAVQIVQVIAHMIAAAAAVAVATVDVAVVEAMIVLAMAADQMMISLWAAAWLKKLVKKF